MTANTQAVRDYFLDNSLRAETVERNPLFRGRKKEIDSVLRSAAKLDRSTVPLANMTALIHGAPGAGKSELMAQLQSRLTTLDTRKPIAFLWGGVELLTNADIFAGALRKALPKRARWPFFAQKVSAEVKGEFLGVGAGSVGIKVEDGSAGTGDIARLMRLTEGPYRRVGLPVIVLMIDEAQHALNAASPVPSNFVSSLHLGQTGMKVLTVYGGLGNTPVELGRCGVSRPGDNLVHPLGPLDDTQVRHMAVEGLSALTAQPPDTIDEWAGSIVRYAQGWPMHLSHALKAVAGQAHPDGWTLDREGFDEAMRVANDNRASYYGQRLQACPQLRPVQFETWAKLFRDGPKDADHVAVALKIPPADADALVAQAVRAGLIEQEKGRKHVSPIPSLLDYVEEEGRAHSRPTRNLGPAR